jgi:hypothetical protein
MEKFDYSNMDHPFTMLFTAGDTARYGDPPFEYYTREGNEGAPPKRVIIFNYKPNGFELVKRFAGVAMHQMGIPDD